MTLVLVFLCLTVHIESAFTASPGKVYLEHVIKETIQQVDNFHICMS